MLESFLRDAIYIVPAVLFSLSIHEFSHGYAAYKLGDPTAKNHGRLTLNPMAHMDLAGTICMLLFRFGWAKPVPVNPMYFKERKKGMALTAAAGPLSNLLMAFVSMIIFYAVSFFNNGNMVMNYIEVFFNVMISLNVGLAVFNLLPISPLDGSKIMYAVLPNHIYFKIMQYERYFMPVLFIMLWFGFLTVPLSILRNFIIDIMNTVVLGILQFIFSGIGLFV